MIERRGAAAYEAVPYTSLPYPRTHPDHLCSMARLAGIAAPAVEGAAVLEIGCGSGGNLLPMAAHLPHARFVGVDLAAAELARAPFVPSNVELRATSGTTVEGRFDYVIAHGVWSWIPEDDRRALLAAIRRVLTPTGVAFVSYNVLPGWHLRGAFRAMLRAHTAGRGAGEAVSAAKELLAYLDRSAPRTGAYRAALDEERARLAAADDGYLFHELLEEHNHPVSVETFVAEAGAAGLSFLCEADPLANPTAGTRRALLPLVGDDPIAVERALDWARGRSFRCSLLVREDAPRGPRPGEGWFVETRLERVGDSFRADDVDVQVSPRVAADLERATAVHPDAAPIGALDDEHVALHEAGLLVLRPRALGLSAEGAPTAVARAFAATTELAWVGNRRHEPIALDPALRAALAAPETARPLLHALAFLG
ncbi:MAG: class I SAM-dependent methyltransferase [Myxococcales bacterium]|nr:class I SAM-dependent methyltransferase [Myxococcales bacterium]